MKPLKDYSLFLKFIDTYLPLAFKDIPNDDPLMLEVNEMLERNNQFLYIADMLSLEILYTSPGLKQVLGIDPKDYDPGFQFRGTHPDDLQRHSLSRSRMIQLCNDLFTKGDDSYAILSTNLKFRHMEGHYVNILAQGYAFTAKTPVHTTYTLFINTDISWFGPIKHGYNYYLGEDMSYFRLPDKELILTGCIFTDREFEIIKLIRDGLDSKKIGEKLFLSTHTVDTHRRNILKKTGCSTISDLVIELQKKGFF